MPVSAFAPSRQRRSRRLRSKLNDATIREFGGGWNVIDAPASLSLRYASILKNFYRKQDGSQALRYGTQYVTNVDGEVSGDILDVKYFNGRIIAITVDGEVASIEQDGTVTAIFNDTIAGNLPGSPSGWSTGITQVDFTEFKGSLVICNGVDKPLEVEDDFAVRYLQDLATGSNVNTPIGFYCTTVLNYLVIAGIDAEPTAIYIGATGTIGTFPGDADPNDSISFDVGAYSSESGNEVRGLSSFRNFLFVHFFDATAVFTLGVFNDSGEHEPVPEDTLPRFGLTSHRCVVPVVNDLLFNDVVGLNTAKRNIFSGAVESRRLSELIAPEYQKSAVALTRDEMQTDMFAVHDRLSGHYMGFVPEGDGVRGFIFTFNERMRVKAWSEFVDWDFTCATSSALGRVFFGKGTKIFQYGNEPYGEEFTADFVGDRDATWANDTAYSVGDLIYDDVTDEVYKCLEAHTSRASGTFATDRSEQPTFWELYEGVPINFDWEFPWSDGGARAKLKRLAFLSFDSNGTAVFNADVFVDRIYKDEDEDYDPALTLKYVAGDSPGYGGGDQPYGGGRRTSDERLWSHPVKFRLMKLRLHGATMEPLRIVSVTFVFATGRYGR